MSAAHVTRWAITESGGIKVAMTIARVFRVEKKNLNWEKLKSSRVLRFGSCVLLTAHVRGKP